MIYSLMEQDFPVFAQDVAKFSAEKEQAARRVFIRIAGSGSHSGYKAKDIIQDRSGFLPDSGG